MLLGISVAVATAPALAVILWHVANAAFVRPRQFRFGMLDLLLATYVAGVAAALVRYGCPWFDAILLVAVGGMAAPLLWLPTLALEDVLHRRRVQADRRTVSFAALPDEPNAKDATTSPVRKRRRRKRPASISIKGVHLSPYSLIERPLRMEGLSGVLRSLRARDRD